MTSVLLDLPQNDRGKCTLGPEHQGPLLPQRPVLLRDRADPQNDRHQGILSPSPPLPVPPVRMMQHLFILPLSMWRHSVGLAHSVRIEGA